MAADPWHLPLDCTHGLGAPRQAGIILGSHLANRVQSPDSTELPADNWWPPEYISRGRQQCRHYPFCERVHWGMQGCQIFFSLLLVKIPAPLQFFSPNHRWNYTHSIISVQIICYLAVLLQLFRRGGALKTLLQTVKLLFQWIAAVFCAQKGAGEKIFTSIDFCFLQFCGISAGRPVPLDWFDSRQVPLIGVVLAKRPTG